MARGLIGQPQLVTSQRKGRMLVTEVRPSRLHPVSRPAMRQGEAGLLEDLAAAAGFHIEARGDLPLLRYVAALRTDRS